MSAVPADVCASQGEAIRACIGAIDAYLAHLDGPGIGAVRDGIAKWSSGEFLTCPPHRPTPVSHVATAVEQLAGSGERELANAISAATPHLHWATYDLYKRDNIGAAFADGHAFVSLIGEEAHIYAVGFDLGLFVIAPHIFYRDHRHAAAELYAPLTGPHDWRFAPEAALHSKPAHAPVWNEPFQPHALRVGAVPFLCIFCWIGDVQQPAYIVPSNDWNMLEVAGVESTAGSA